MNVKFWYDRKIMVNEEEYNARFSPFNHGRYEAERLEFAGIPPGVRISERATGRMVGGWDQNRDGSYTYWIVSE